MSTLSSVIIEGLAASRPTAGIPGRIYFATDTKVLSYDNGTSWDTWSPGSAATSLQFGATNQTLSATAPTSGQFLKYDGTNIVGAAASGGASLIGMITPSSLTPPTVSSFTWLNQGTATTSTNSGGAVWQAITSAAGADSYHVLYIATPATPWSAILGFEGICSASVADFFTAGLILRESATGKLITHVRNFGSADNMQVNKFTNPTTFSAAYMNIANNNSSPITWLKVTDDGTNFTFYTGADGQNWVQIFQTPVNNFFTTTADGVGFGFDNSKMAGGMLVLHWFLG